MTADIGIVGAGTAGLHLALMLQQRGVDATLYAERTADEVLAGRLANTVAHHHHTRERERELGVNHWDETGPSYGRHWHYFGGEQPLAFPGDFAAPSLAVDYRLYQSRLLQDYEERGGTVRFGVGGGRSGRAAGCGTRSGRRLHRPGRLVGSLPAGAGPVARRAAPPPLRRPVRGHRLPRPGRSDVRGLPGARRADRDPAPDLRGERDDAAVRGGSRAATWRCSPRTPYDDDPAGYERLALEKLREHFPPVFERADPAAFGLTRPSSIVQGAVTPTVRKSFATLDDGTCAIAVGDAHVVVDPLVGQGANSASFSTWTLGEAILEDGPLDEAFCRRVDERRLPFVLGAYDWTNFMTAPEPHLFALVGAMSQSSALADDFTNNFNHPDRQWQHLSSPEATEAYVGRFLAPAAG